MSLKTLRDLSRACEAHTRWPENIGGLDISTINGRNGRFQVGGLPGELFESGGGDEQTITQARCMGVIGEVMAENPGVFRMRFYYPSGRGRDRVNVHQFQVSMMPEEAKATSVETPEDRLVKAQASLINTMGINGYKSFKDEFLSTADGVGERLGYIEAKLKELGVESVEVLVEDEAPDSDVEF